MKVIRHCWQKKDYFIYKTIYTNFTVTTKYKSRAESQNMKEKTEKHHRTKWKTETQRKRDNGQREQPENNFNLGSTKFSSVNNHPKCESESVSHSVKSDFAIPWTVARQAPLSTEFSRTEYWSGLPFASPGDLPDPGIKPRSPALQANSLSSESPGKSKTTGVGSYSLLQGIFPTQGSNPGLLPCRQLLYCLSHQGSP